MSALLRALFALSLTLGGFFSFTAESWADNCTVTSDEDSGPGTLRNCLQNVAVNDGDVVTVPVMTVFLYSGDLEVNRAITVRGAGMGQTVIDGSGNGDSRIFHVTTVSGQTTLIEGIEMRGMVTEETGAGVFATGNGSLHLRDCAIRDNVQNFTGALTDQGGAGIFSETSLIVENCEITGNVIHGEGTGAGILSTGITVLLETLIENNDATDTPFGAGGMDVRYAANIINSTLRLNRGALGGGGIFESAAFTNVVVAQNSSLSNVGGVAFLGTARVNQSAFYDNRAEDGAGGGIFACGSDVMIQDATLAGNTAREDGAEVAGLGGGIYNCGTLAMTNVTLFNNAAELSGGGVYNSSLGEMSLVNVTIASNTADADSADENLGEGGGIYSSGSFSLRHSIVAGNHDLSGGGIDCFNEGGTFSAFSKNIVQDIAGCDTFFGSSGSLTGADPLLHTELADNGGSPIGRGSSQAVWTLWLNPGSPAIDAGDLPDCVEYDQRGVGRPVGPSCDLGAVEIGGFEPEPSPEATPSAGPTPVESPLPGSNPSDPVLNPPTPGVPGGGGLSGGGCGLGGGASLPALAWGWWPIASLAALGLRRR